MSIKFDEERQNRRLEELRNKESEDLAKMLSERYGVGYVNLMETPIDTNALRLIREEDAKRSKIAGIKLNGKKLIVAVMSPQIEETQLAIKKLEERGFSVETYIASERGLEYAWQRYKDISFATESSAGTLDIASNSIEDFIKQVRGIEDAKKLISDVFEMKKSFRISRIVEIIIAAAISTKASDVHVEPAEENVQLRFRIDGVLVEVETLDIDTYKLLRSRIKLLSGMKLNIKDEAQNGRFEVKIGDTDFDIRSSVLPGNTGESIVLRILDPSTLTVPLESIGIPENLLPRLLTEVDRPNGLILNTGPTGSGKTTTLYSFLNRKRNPDIKIITIEDPIEYQLPGIVQTQVNSKEEYDFASGLKNSLRQDPDVIMVGEIRENETAETAVQAALTGHLVFSTLHTNDAAGSFPRLVDLGVDPKVMTSAINAVIAQRLVRKICPHCQQKEQLEGIQFENYKKIHESIIKDGITDINLPEFTGSVLKANPEGCSECNNTGYSGRLGIFEAIFMDKAVERTVQDMASASEIRLAAKKQKILSMAQDGLVKVLAGVTTVEEVERVVDLKKVMSDLEEEEKNLGDSDEFAEAV